MLTTPATFFLIGAINLLIVNYVCASEGSEEPKKDLFEPVEKLGAEESKYESYLYEPDYVEHKHKYDKYHGPNSQTLKPIAALGDPYEYFDKLKIYKAIKPEKKHHYTPPHEIVTLKPIAVGKQVDFGGHGVIYETPANYGHQEQGLYQDIYKNLENDRHKAEYNRDLYKLLEDQQHKGVPSAVGVGHYENPVVVDKPTAYGYPVGYEHTQLQIPHHTDDGYYHREEKKEEKKHYSLNDYKKKKLLKPIEWLLKAKEIFWKL